ncbi:MAG: phosphatidate cytidylyltransferase, partial [Kiritimatiellia bacterium]
LFTFLVKLAYTWDTPGMTSALGVTGRRLFIYFLAVVKLTDVGAYTCGSLWGRHRLMPRISPGKTLEGLMGGVLAGLLASLFCWWLWGGQLGVLTLDLPRALALGIILPLAGVVGDLMESMFKRAAGAKDSSSCFPGLGGLLDVLD